MVAKEEVARSNLERDSFSKEIITLKQVSKVMAYKMLLLVIIGIREICT